MLLLACLSTHHQREASVARDWPERELVPNLQMFPSIVCLGGKLLCTTRRTGGWLFTRSPKRAGSALVSNAGGKGGTGNLGFAPTRLLAAVALLTLQTSEVCRKAMSEPSARFQLGHLFPISSPEEKRGWGKVTVDSMKPMCTEHS